MRRLFLIALMLVMAGVAYAQEVVQYPYHCYMEWPMPMPMDSSYHWEMRSSTGQHKPYFTGKWVLGKARAREFVVDTPTTIYGIAAILWGQDTARRDVVVTLYSYENGKANPVTEVRWFDSMPFRYVVFEASNCGRGEGDNNFYSFYRDTVSAYDFYFDTPITVTDTFLVGIHTLGVDGLQHEHFGGNNLDTTGYVYLVRKQVTCDPNYPRPKWFFYYDKILHPYSSGGDWAGVLPIIEEPPCNPDTLSCPTVVEFSARPMDSLNVEFVWHSLPQQQAFQISVCRPGTPPDEGTIYDAGTSPMVVTDRWDTTATYVAYIRTQCHRHCHPNDTLVWSDWTGPVTFFGYQPSDPTGIATTDRDTQLFTLTPNPAKGTVTVRTSAYSQGSTLTLRDAAGRELLTTPVTTPSLTIPLRDYPVGTYLVTLTTKEGSSTQRLVVE